METAISPASFAISKARTASAIKRSTSFAWPTFSANSRFGIPRWDPPGANGMIGEFLLSRTGVLDAFVEIKSRGWESELTQAQKDAGMAKLLKYDVWKGGAIGNWQAVHACISSPNCYPKFKSTGPNLLIIADDLNVSLHDSLFQVHQALFGEQRFFGEEGYFNTNRFENIGALGIFNFTSRGEGVEYEFVVVRNPMALPVTQLPLSWSVYETKLTHSVRGTDPRRGIWHLYISPSPCHHQFRTWGQTGRSLPFK